MQPPKRKRWSTAGDLVRSFGFRQGLEPDRLSILNSVWEKELGHMSGQWALMGVKKGVLYVRPRSSAAAQELQMRASSIMRGLNKYFSKGWIKAIKTSYR